MRPLDGPAILVRDRDDEVRLPTRALLHSGGLQAVGDAAGGRRTALDGETAALQLGSIDGSRRADTNCWARAWLPLKFRLASSGTQGSCLVMPQAKC